MLSVARMEIIKQLYEEENWDISKLSRKFSHSRNTIRKYLNGGTHEYKRKGVAPSPIKEEVSELIKKWYEEDLEGPRKQRRTARKMTQDLVEHYDYKGSYSTVKEVLRNFKGPNKEVYVPREHKPGAYCEFDFGELYLNVGSEWIKVYLHAFQLCYSNDIFGYLSLRATQEEMYESHKRAFEHFGGVPLHMRYDNLSLAVKKVLKGRKREETDSFKSFKEQYNFESVFCAVGRGQEKGDVEGCVGYIRRNHLSPMPKLNKLLEYEKLNEPLEKWCKSLRKTRDLYLTPYKVGEGYLIEKSELHLLPTTTPEVGKKSIGKSNHYALVCVEQVFYSVPVNYAYRVIDIMLTAREVILSFKTEEIARHKRTWEKGKQVFKPVHYLNLFKKKPYSLLNSKPIAELPPCFKQFFEKAYQRGYGTVKECLGVLELLETYPLKEVAFAVELASSYHTYYAEGVKTLLKQLLTSEPTFKKIGILKRPELTSIKIPEVDLSRYQGLALGGETK